MGVRPGPRYDQQAFDEAIPNKTMTQPKENWNGDVRHEPADSLEPPDLYNRERIAEKLDGWDALGEAAAARYREQGFLVIGNAFGDAQVEAARQDLSDLIMGRVEGFAGIKFERWARDKLDQLALEERESAVRKLMDFVQHGDGLRSIAEDARFLGALRRLLGDQTPSCFQEMALLKPPRGVEKPWHQDKAYFDYDVRVPVVGAWIALDEATKENGCMHFIAGSHREGPIIHFQRRDWQICDTEMQGRPAVAAPVSAGDCILFDGLVHHGTPTNRTDKRRRAIQLHYAPAGTIQCATEERLKWFGSEGKDVEC